MEPMEGKYNIKAISNMLGIQPGTLRAWERRYNIVHPERNSAGHRLYTEKDAAVLKWILDKTSSGFTVSQAVGLLDKFEEIDSMAAHPMEVDHTFALAEEILGHLLRFREAEAQEALNRAFSMFTLEKVTTDILGTLLVKVGTLWEMDQITIAHEHYITSFLRTKIGSIMHSYNVKGFLPKIVTAAGPNENHELGLLFFTLYLKRKGFEVIYLGVGIPEEDLIQVMGEIDSSIFFTSCTLLENLEPSLEFITELETLHPHLSIGMGGHAVQYMDVDKTKEYSRFLIGSDASEWDEWISNVLYKKMENRKN